MAAAPPGVQYQHVAEVHMLDDALVVKAMPQHLQSNQQTPDLM
jgi:hypothetical protein